MRNLLAPDVPDKTQNILAVEARTWLETAGAGAPSATDIGIKASEMVGSLELEDLWSQF